MRHDEGIRADPLRAEKDQIQIKSPGNVMRMRIGTPQLFLDPAAETQKRFGGILPIAGKHAVEEIRRPERHVFRSGADERRNTADAESAVFEKLLSRAENRGGVSEISTQRNNAERTVLRTQT